MRALVLRFLRGNVAPVPHVLAALHRVLVDPAQVSRLVEAYRGGAKLARDVEVGADDPRMLVRDPRFAWKKVGAAAPIVLSTDPRSLSRWRALCADVLHGWMLGFDPQWVHVHSDEGDLQHVVLDWPSQLGPAPSSFEDLAPTAALCSLALLPGWKKLANEERATLERILRRHDNPVSSSMLRYFRSQIGDLVARPEEAQRMVLEKALHTKDALPQLAEAKVQTTVTVSLSGPTNEHVEWTDPSSWFSRGHDFRGTRVEADVWTARFSDGTTLFVIAPRGPTPGYHNLSVEKIADAARYVPRAKRALIKRIELCPSTNPDDPSWALKYKNPDFHSFMTAGPDGVVDVYPTKTGEPEPGNDVPCSTVHESSHIWSFQQWGTDTTHGTWVIWKSAMDRDGTSVSGYATSAIEEDVAETVTAYEITAGTPAFAGYRAVVPNRFAILDKELT